MMDLPPSASIRMATCWQQDQDPSTFTRIVVEDRRRHLLRREPAIGGDAGRVHEHVNPADARCRLPDHGLDGRWIADVTGDGHARCPREPSAAASCSSDWHAAP